MLYSLLALSLQLQINTWRRLCVTLKNMESIENTEVVLVVEIEKNEGLVALIKMNSRMNRTRVCDLFYRNFREFVCLLKR